MPILNPALTIDCPRCGGPILVLVEAGGMSVGTKADGTAEASITITPNVQPHTCTAVDSASDDQGNASADAARTTLEADGLGTVRSPRSSDDAGTTCVCGDVRSEAPYDLWPLTDQDGTVHRLDGPCLDGPGTLARDRAEAGNDVSDAPWKMGRDPMPRPRKTEHGYPSRSDIRWMTLAERSIREAMMTVEELGADERLTKAVVLLGDAMGWVADYIEDVPTDEHYPRPAPSASPDDVEDVIADALVYCDPAGGLVFRWSDDRLVLLPREAHSATREIRLALEAKGFLPVPTEGPAL